MGTLRGRLADQEALCSAEMPASISKVESCGGRYPTSSLGLYIQTHAYTCTHTHVLIHVFTYF